MNAVHRWYCRSGSWADQVRDRILPWVLRDTDLGDDVLEVGPGPGVVTELLRARTTRLTSVEIDPRLAASLRERFTGSNVAVHEGDATRMPFAAGSFSGAVSMTMLHHVPSSARQDELLSEVHRVLRPGAVFAGCDSRSSLFFRLAHVLDTMVLVDPETFAQRLERAGFREVRVEVRSAAFRFRAVA